MNHQNGSRMEDNKIEISHLPPELLENILTFLTKNEQLTARLVCKYWLSTIASSPTITHNLYLSNCLVNSEFAKVFLNTELRITAIICKNASFAKEENLKNFWSKIGEKVKEIYIKKKVEDEEEEEEEEYPETCIGDAVRSGLKASYFPNLRKLKVDLLPLFYEMIDENLEEWDILLNQVQNLSVNYLYHEVETKDVHLTMSNVTELTVDGCHNETIERFFERIAFPCIENLVLIHVTYRTLELFDLFKMRFNFSQLKSLFAAQYFDWEESDFNLIINNCGNLEYLGIGIITKYREHSKDLKCDEIATKCFKKLTSLKGVYFVTFSNTEEKSFKSYQKTPKGFSTSDEPFGPFAAIQSPLKN